MIRFDNVSLVLNRTAILENVNFHVGKGEYVLLFGTSGAGKSSILKLIHGDIHPTVGTVTVRDADTRTLTRSKLARHRRSVGFIFQDYKLIPNKTAYENVAFALEVTGEKRRTIRQKAIQALHTVGLGYRLQHYPHDLSGGECQRVAIARAIVLEPFILLADEPTGNLDDENAWAIVKLLNAINHAGTAVLMATHKPTFTRRLNARILTLNHGRLSPCMP